VFCCVIATVASIVPSSASAMPSCGISQTSSAKAWCRAPGWWMKGLGARMFERIDVTVGSLPPIVSPSMKPNGRFSPRWAAGP
jgi:hypothetical protein